MKTKLVVLAGLAVLAVGNAALASGDPVADKCAAGKTITAGKYATCVAAAEAILATTGDQATYDVLLAKCSLKLSKPWARLETAAVVGGSSCPAERDGQAVKDFVDACMKGVADACNGNGLPSYAGCATDLATGQADLGASGASLGDCTDTLGTCTSNLSGCQTDLSTTNAYLGACDTGLANCQSGYAACTSNCDAVVRGPLATGQTTSYGPGSDGDLQKGAVRSFTDNGDGTITDNVTGLMWEKKSDDGSIHDWDNTYTWGINTSPYTMDGTVLTTFLMTLNGGGGFAGYTDWRIPNNFELFTLVNQEVYEPSTYPAFNINCTSGCSVTTCSCTRSGYYWSSTAYQYNPAGAWFVDFSDGRVNAYGKIDSYAVRAVRAGS